MYIDFIPALKSEFHAQASSRLAVLNFTATLGLHDYHQLKRDGASVQLWSDIPLGVGTPPGQWHEYRFEEVPSSTAVALGDIRSSDETEESSPFLQLSLPTAAATQPRHFSFTYRIVYPTGEITWLGQFDQNGTVLLEYTPRPALVIISEEWSEGEDGGGYTQNAPGPSSATDVEVARLVDPFEFSVYAIDGTSPLDVLLIVRGSQLVFLIPRFQPRAVIRPPIYVASTSPEASISVSSLGVITASGAGSLQLQAYDLHQLNTPTLVESLLAQCDTAYMRQNVMVDVDRGYILLTTSKTAAQVKIAIIPIMPSPIVRSHTVSVATDALATLLSTVDNITEYSIFCPPNLDIQFFEPASHKKDIPFVIDPSGGEFILSPVFDWKDKNCSVSVVSTHKPTRPSPKREPGILPTPPPSPRLHPTVEQIAPDMPHSPSSPPSDTKASEPTGGTIKTGLGTMLYATIVTYIKFIFSFISLGFKMVYRPLSNALGHRGFRGGGTVASVPKEKRKGHSAAGDIPKEPPRPADHGETNRGGPGLAPSPLLLPMAGAGKVQIAMRFRDDAAPAGKISVEVNGKTAQPTLTASKERACLLLEFDNGEGGLASISF